MWFVGPYYAQYITMHGPKIVKKMKKNYNFACGFVWVWNLVVDFAGGKEAEGIWEHGVEENIWT